jgi:hypothetical protein
MCCAVLCCAGFKKVGNAGLLETVGVSADAAMTKMRLMALLMLGSKASGAPVAFTDIQAALDIAPEQVRRGLLLLLLLLLPVSGGGGGECNMLSRALQGTSMGFGDRLSERAYGHVMVCDSPGACCGWGHGTMWHGGLQAVKRRLDSMHCFLQSHLVVSVLCVGGLTSSCALCHHGQ